MTPVRLRGKGGCEATPYLRKWRDALLTAGVVPGLVVDLATGNGRNADHLRNYGCTVHGFDAEPDHRSCWAQHWLAGERLPGVADDAAFLVLCQYLLMFLDDAKIAAALDEADRVLRPQGFILVELQEVKQGRPVRLGRVVEYLQLKRRPEGACCHCEPAYEVVHQAKDRCILRKLR